jgi:serine protease Do
MMRTTWARAAAVALVAVVFGGAGTESQAQYARKTPIVEAVQKTRNGIVSVKVDRRGNWGRREVVGTGVVVDERGFVVTNCHVVSGSERVTVELADGRSLQARVHVEDTSHDLAILHLPEARKLQALTFGPASDLMVGETVIAVGHPFGYTNTVSTGIISALGREISMPSGANLTGLIQTNASINPGNSGGPLLNINGELIGLNVAVREGAQGIAFALNADTVKEVLSKHLSAGKLSHLQHGIRCRERVKAEAAVVPEGRQQVVVEAVVDSSPAAEAGLKSGDVIVRLGQRAVSNRFDLERALWGYKAGEEIEAAILRDGRPTRLAIKLAETERVTANR